MNRKRDKLIMASLFFIVFAVMSVVLKNYLFIFVGLIAFLIIYLSKSS